MSIICSLLWKYLTLLFSLSSSYCCQAAMKIEGQFLTFRSWRSRWILWQARDVQACLSSSNEKSSPKQHCYCSTALVSTFAVDTYLSGLALTLALEDILFSHWMCLSIPQSMDTCGYCGFSSIVGLSLHLTHPDTLFILHSTSSQCKADTVIDQGVYITTCRAGQAFQWSPHTLSTRLSEPLFLASSECR